MFIRRQADREASCCDTADLTAAWGLKAAWPGLSHTEGGPLRLSLALPGARAGSWLGWNPCQTAPQPDGPQQVRKSHAGPLTQTRCRLWENKPEGKTGLEAHCSPVATRSAQAWWGLAGWAGVARQPAHAFEALESPSFVATPTWRDLWFLQILQNIASLLHETKTVP